MSDKHQTGMQRGDTRPFRIALWSGPRTISTALMRSWESRDDTFVCDEPLYAHYLAAMDIDHPGREEIIARAETDWHNVVAALTGPIPEGKSIFYQKHMAHHLLPGVVGDWLDALHHAFLIRNPEELLISLSKVTADPRLEDTGLPQQLGLFERIGSRRGEIPPIIDARDVLDHPRRLLRRLCHALGVEFTDAMLSWRAGPRATDGIWARYWYANVVASTGFKPYEPPTSPLAAHLRPLERECRRYYDEMYRHRLS